MSIYLKIPNIKGDVSDQHHKDWVQLLSWEHGLSRNTRMQVGDMHNREIGIPVFGEFILTKKVDQATPHFFQQICSGKSLSTVTLEICDTQGTYLKYQLSDVILTKREIMMTDGIQPYEMIHLSYSKIEETFTGRNAQHNPVAPVTSGYDLVEASYL